MAVAWGVEHRDLDNIMAIASMRSPGESARTIPGGGLPDRFQVQTPVWVGQSRTKRRRLQDFFDEFGKERAALLRVICTDMWKTLSFRSNLSGTVKLCGSPGRAGDYPW